MTTSLVRANEGEALYAIRMVENIIFDPFYSTKPQGLGLGLYITHQIVEAHGGHIDVRSRLGEGTTFSVWLPA